MKKTNTKLHLSTTTVRVLRDSALVEVRGGGPVTPSDHPWACVGRNYGAVNGADKP